MLFGRQAGQGIEDVGVVRGALLDGPVLHGRGHGVGDRAVELLALFDRPLERLEDQLRQPLLHLGQAEDVRAIEFAGGRLGEVQRGRNGLVIGNGLNRLQTRRTATHVLIPPCAVLGKRKTDGLSTNCMRGGRKVKRRLDFASRRARPTARHSCHPAARLLGNPRRPGMNGIERRESLCAKMGEFTRGTLPRQATFLSRRAAQLHRNPAGALQRI